MNGLKKRPEYKKISASLQPNEEVRAYGVAYIGSTDHTVVVTNSRILIVAEKLFTKHFDSIPFGNVLSLSLKKGLSGTFLEINKIKLKFRNHKEAEAIYSMLTVGESTNNTEKSEVNIITDSEKKSTAIFGLVVLGAIFGIGYWISNFADDETIQQPTEIIDVIVYDQAKHDEEQRKQAEELANRDPIIIDIERAVNNDKITSATVLRNAQLNTNANKVDTKIALIYLRWDRKNDPAQTKSMLQMYSARLANEIGKHKNVSEIVIFWEVPYHVKDQNIAKFNYSKKNNELVIDNEWFAPVIR